MITLVDATVADGCSPGGGTAAGTALGRLLGAERAGLRGGGPDPRAVDAERMRPDHAWSLDVLPSTAAPPVPPPACTRNGRPDNCNDTFISSNIISPNKNNNITLQTTIP